MKKGILPYLFALMIPLAAQTYTLDSLLEAARKNPVLQIASLETQMARTTVQEATGATMPKISAGLYGQFETKPESIDDYLPGFVTSVNGIVDYINGLGSAINGLTHSSSFPVLPSFKTTEPRKFGALFEAELMQPLFTWGKIAYSIKMAKLGVQAKQIQQLTAERELLTQVVLQTAQLFYLQKMEETAAAQQKTAERFKVIADENAANKLILPVDAYGTAIQLLEIQAAREQLQARIQSALFTLKESTQLRDITHASIDFAFIPQNFAGMPRMSIEEAIKYLNNESAEVLLLDLKTNISNEQRKIASSDAWAKPDIGLKLAYKIGTNPFSTSSSNLLRWNFTAAIAINSTIFNGTQDIARLKRTGLETQKTVYEKYRDLASLEIKLRELDSAIVYKLTYITLYEQKLLQSNQLLEIKKKEFAAGYIEERDYLAEQVQNMAIQTQLEQNRLSFFADYCMYNYLCGKFPQDYLTVK